MTWFGDICIPWITDKDTSITKELVEKNFVNEPSQVYELTPNLESGTYTFILNEKYHQKDESMNEQEDAVLSMVSRHATEFPFEIAGDRGYVLVESASVTTSPTLEIRNADIDIRFLDADTYYSAVKATPKPIRNADFNLSAEPVESLVAFPSKLDIINYNADYTVSTAEGDVDLYTFDERSVFEYNELEKIHESQQIAICRLFNSDDQRLYSDSKIVDNDSYVSNGLIKNTYKQDSADLEYYDGEWVDIGSILIPFDDGYGSTNENDEVTVSFINGNQTSLYRGFSIIRYDFTNESSFEFESTKSITEKSIERYYAHYVHEDGYDLVIVRTSIDGSFFDDGNVFGVQDLITSKEYTIYVGVVPENISVSDYARYVYNFGNRKRTFTQGPAKYDVKIIRSTFDSVYDVEIAGQRFIGDSLTSQYDVEIAGQRFTGDSLTSQYDVEIAGQRFIGDSLTSQYDVEIAGQRFTGDAFTSNYEITIDSTNSPVVEGEELIVQSTIENTGQISDQQDILLINNQNILDSQSVSLEGGQSQNIELVWSTESGDSGIKTIIVQSDDDSSSKEVIIEEPFVEYDVEIINENFN